MRNLVFRAAPLWAVLSLAAPHALTAQDSQTPLATVAGQPIYEQDLMSVAGPGLQDLHRQEYKLKSDALNQIIRKKVIEGEAKRRSLGSEDLLRQEVDSKIPDPSDEEAKGYYLAVSSQTTLPFDQIKLQVKQLLKGAEIQQARERYADSLRDQIEVVILLEPPVVEVNYDPARVKGDANAPVTIVEFADFQCPFCSRVEPLLNHVLAKYDGKVKLAYRDFPLASVHGHAELAAEASRCALAQGKYWEMHDAMFADQSKLDEASLIKSAGGLGMDQHSFAFCVKSGNYKEPVQQDFRAGSDAGVNATPSFFINGEFLGGAQSDSDFARIIDRQLAVLARKGSLQSPHMLSSRSSNPF